MGAHPLPTLRARSASQEASLVGGWACGLDLARIEVISCKVSQNGGVSPRNVGKACHAPYFQNRLGKSPLEILRFPYLAAFSHKELMGYFEARAEFIVKTTKCR